MADTQFFIPHPTECWAPASGRDDGPYALVEPLDGRTTPATHTIDSVTAIWPALKDHAAFAGVASDASALLKTLDAVIDPLEGKDNLADLQVVSEGAVLHAIRKRYVNRKVYTNVGRIVIAVNPFEARPDLYNDALITKYSTAENPYTLEPHIFQIAAAASKGATERNKSQSTLITGESGAGKTETTKILLKFIAFSKGSRVRSMNSQLAGNGGALVEERILKANPIMEAFGNASTSRNPNSSRFGKWVEIYFDRYKRVKGATITVYMLETPRVCEHLHSDRNYHIFYQICKNRLGGLSGKFSDYLYLTPRPPPKEGSSPGHGKHIDDEEMYGELDSGLDDFGLTQNEKNSVFEIISAILHLGNIDFVAATSGNTDCSIIKSLAPLQTAAKLLGCPESVVRACVSQRRLTVGKDVTEIPLKLVEAQAARDGLSKLIYSSLFNWLTFRINDVLAPRNHSTTPQSSATIGILDIAGFESFAVNSYEQLLINLSNEKLQQRFNSDVIRSELEDYKSEGVHDITLDFKDNKPIIQLIEGKGGLVDVLDEELSIPKGTDSGFVSKAIRKFAGHPNILASKFSGGVPIFGIVHFAGTVNYTCIAWLDKNRLQPPREALDVLAEAHNNVVKKVVSEMNIDLKSKQTVGSSFVKQLRDLMTKIEATDSHYVRCVKPNATHNPGEVESLELMRQLKCAGVMEAIKIRKSGFSLRIPFQNFNERYSILLGALDHSSSPDVSRRILETVAESVPSKSWILTPHKVMTKDVVRLVLDQERSKKVEGLRRLLMPFTDLHEVAVSTQEGMFLFPEPLLGPTCNTPEHLREKVAEIDAGLTRVLAALGSLDGLAWVAGTLTAKDAMLREAAVAEAAEEALLTVAPGELTPDAVANLRRVVEMGRIERVQNSALNQISRALILVEEETDWTTQLNSEDTDIEGLLSEIMRCQRALLTPSCGSAVEKAKRRMAEAKRRDAERNAERNAIESPPPIRPVPIDVKDPVIRQTTAKRPPDKMQSRLLLDLGASLTPATITEENLSAKAKAARAISKRPSHVVPDQATFTPVPRAKTKPPPRSRKKF